MDQARGDWLAFSNAILFYITTADGVLAQVSATPPPVNQWSHVVGTYDGANIRVSI